MAKVIAKKAKETDRFKIAQGLYSELQSKVCYIIADRVRGTKHLALETRIRDIKMDSLDAAAIAMGLEDEFDFALPGNFAESARTIRDIVEYVIDNSEMYSSLVRYKKKLMGC